MYASKSFKQKYVIQVLIHSTHFQGRIMTSLPSTATWTNIILSARQSHELNVDQWKCDLHTTELGIEFYLFVSHGGMNDRGSTCKFRNARSAFRNLHVDPVFHTSMINKQVELNPYIYTLSKLYRFGYEISVF